MDNRQDGAALQGFASRKPAHKFREAGAGMPNITGGAFQGEHGKTALSLDHADRLFEKLILCTAGHEF